MFHRRKARWLFHLRTLNKRPETPPFSVGMSSWSVAPCTGTVQDLRNKCTKEGFCSVVRITQKILWSVHVFITCPHSLYIKVQSCVMQCIFMLNIYWDTAPWTHMKASHHDGVVQGRTLRTCSGYPSIINNNDSNSKEGHFSVNWSATGCRVRQPALTQQSTTEECCHL